MRHLILFLLILTSQVIAKEPKTIAIVTYKVNNAPKWDPDSINKGINGSEEAVIYVSKELANLGYEVTVLGDPPENSKYSSSGVNPRYIDLSKEDPKHYDIAIAWRDPYAAKKLSQKADYVYLWPHDTFPWKMDPHAAVAFDGVLWISCWQREDWVKYNPSFAKYQNIFANGIVPDQFKEVTERKNPYSCIYGSNYARGLDILLDIWPEVRKQYPEATLDIYYGWQHWGLLSKEKEEKMKKQVADLKSMGVTDHGNVGHQELNDAYAEASFWTYPCTAVETFSITAIRAQMSGAVPVIIQGSAMNETVRHGYHCQSCDQYLETLLKAMGEAKCITVADRKKMQEFILNEYTWKKVAQDWDKYFKEVAAANPKEALQTAQ